ncbi:HAD-IB family hydrolase [Robbsia sp. Bb-Pol-6]|uniref:HAD-IB family hydrolase n=1 Tax=Robbsia betulipollinis TaxID=2981849 RepID=A0ABT3ZQI8_9BURK|nr:HAD family hydrolase [Robbsia betulipollinis]MCY0388821.1 HAD-IB family hydrolase [Robbsia betulipollinis]
MTRLALFDLDHTLIPTDSDHEWGRFMIKLGLVDAAQFARDNERFYADYQNGCLDIHAYLRVALAPLTRHARDTLDDWHRQFMAEVITPAIRPEALALVAGHQARGDLCCVITATNAFVTGPIARALGIDNLIAIDLATEGGAPRGRFTGEIAGEPSFREGKITRTQQWLATRGKTLADFEQSFFYSDSRNDIPLLEKVSDPVATNPDDTLRAHAKAHGWRTLELFH